MAVDDAGNGAQPAAEDERGLVPMIGPSAVEVQGQDQEAVQVDGVVLTASSVLKDLRTACRFLGVSNNGSKATVWARLKKDVAVQKLKASVQASEEIQKQYEREPIQEALTKPPEPHLVALHEITHMQKRPLGARHASPRGPEKTTTQTPSPNVRTLSLQLTTCSKTDGENQRLATHLVCSDSQTK